LVPDGFSTVRFFSPFDDFRSSPVPDGADSYLAYREAAIEFIEARNERIAAWWATHLAAR
jgi:hypothetical protein